MITAYLALAVLTATADAPAVHAIVVASSEGGEGQSPLRHAADDARAVEAVLGELGRAQVTRLLDPTPAQVESAIAATRGRIEAAGAGSTMFVFYYSGHARAEAIDLGDAPLPLDRLRAALDAVPATVRLVVLDACQSGAYSAVKGAAPAAQFTISSARALATEGSAVIASSTGSELSQESPELGGSYFTHHWVVGLRGAGDTNGDGRVTLREAYDYAYHHTLISTSMTAVGRQHPVLETRLKGHGDLVLAYPAEARAHLDIASREATSVLVSTARDVVMAEVQAPAGIAVRLALPAGDYVAYARGPRERRRCEVRLVEGVAARVDPSQCPVVEAPRTLAKGGVYGWDEGWGVEVGLGLRFPIDDGYVDRLTDFGYAPRLDLREGFRGRVSVLRRIVDELSGVLALDLVDQRLWRKTTPRTDGTEQITEFDLRVWAVTASARYGVPISDSFSAYAQAGGGLAFGGSSLGEFDETHFGLALLVGAGLDYRINDFMSLYLQLGWSSARVVTNLAGDTHESGGFDDTFGLRFEL